MGIPDSPKRVYHFLLDHRLGGPHVFVESIAGPLRERGGYDFTIVTTGKGPITDISLINLRHIWFPLYVLELVINCLLITWYAATRKIARKDALFHVHGAANIAPVLGAFVLRVPVIWHFHDVLPEIRSLVRVGLVFVSRTPHRLATVTKKSVEVYDLPEAALIPAPIDAEYWRADAAFERSEREPFKIVNTANLNSLKGQDVLLDALRGLEGKWELSLIGPFLATHARYGEALRKCANEIERENPDHRVEFRGWLDRDQIRRELRGCDVFVLPSRNEACPIALLEAMALGRVCIASRVGGIETIIENSVSGYLVHPDDPEMLLKALRAVRSMDRQTAKSMGGRAREQILRDHSLSSVVDRLSTLYAEVQRG